MCYSIYLSTDSNRDLSTENSDLLRFKQETIEEPIRSILQNEHQWYVGSQSGCSCTFRHLYSTELGFAEPVDWYQEDDDEILRAPHDHHPHHDPVSSHQCFIWPGFQIIFPLPALEIGFGWR